ncbi:superinfection immunity protein [Massilia sp. CFBP9012]|uniref:superinfection immunity protein n=1 Tax=Massilia sp. CFBP9012 TaxID=3096531 RepID=UPI002A6ABAA5|nr:superinfection immunity protein [Massilia sp. CFBP9012]MDY0973672.1 superinfection immunity protein [Massilia sp. CFBP9012]
MKRILRIGIVLLAASALCLVRIALVLLGSTVYLLLLPGVIAMKRDYPHADRVFLWCALLGWTGAAWVAALVFVLTRRTNAIRRYALPPG